MSWHLSLENIAGIRRADARLEPGVNAVRASNWQGKSSFLSGIETAFGTATPLTEGQSSGQAVLQTEEGEFRVRLERAGRNVMQSGESYLNSERDRACATLFAFLDEDNEVRQAVRNGANLEELLTRPLDFENIDERIADLRAEREQVERELERAERAAQELPELQERVTDLESELESLRAEREELDDGQADEQDARETLSSLRAEREQVTSRVDRLEATVERIRETLSEKRSERESLTVPSNDDIEQELADLQEELRAIERDRELLQSVYEANRRVLDEGRVELLTDVSHEMLDDTMTCWLCGDDATQTDIESQLAALDDRIEEFRTTAADLRERVEALENRREELTAARRRENDLTERIAELESRLAESEESLESARERQAELTARIDALAAEVETIEDRLMDLESEIKYTEAELADAREQLEETAAEADTRETLESEYDSLNQEITDLRTRKQTIERRTRDAFSHALEDLLGRFDTGFETARLTSTFDLVVARDGREAQLDALSEGERELLGIVAALAGYEAFDVSDSVPVMLLDSLGGLASENVELLVEYLADRTEYLVLTAYPEYEGFHGNELSPADWEVVSQDTDERAAT